MENEGTFIWDHSRQLLADTYTNWDSLQPNNVDNQDFLEVMVRYGGRWNDISEQGSSAYVCERGELTLYYNSKLM